MDAYETTRRIEALTQLVVVANERLAGTERRTVLSRTTAALVDLLAIGGPASGPTA